MIKINLLGEKKDNSVLYALQLLAFGCVLVLTLGACFVIHSTRTTDLELLQQEQTLAEAQAKKLRAKTKKVKELDKKRTLLSEKLMTIAKLKARKQGPVRVLDDLTVRIPERAWLTQVSQKGDIVEFQGVALDNQTISSFMASLQESQYFDGVDLEYSRQYIREEVKLQKFSLSAKLTSMLNLRKGAPQDDEKAGAEEEGGGRGA